MQAGEQPRTLLYAEPERTDQQAIEQVHVNDLVLAHSEKSTLALLLPGWIVKCTELACEPRYWCEHGLLCVDTEAAVRHGALDWLRPPAADGHDYPIDSEQSLTEGGSTASGLITPKQAGV